MNCPYCKARVHGMTGFQEALAFRKHLGRCKKNPANLPISDGLRTVLIDSQPTIHDALEIRAEIGQ